MASWRRWRAPVSDGEAATSPDLLVGEVNLPFTRRSSPSVPSLSSLTLGLDRVAVRGLEAEMAELGRAAEEAGDTDQRRGMKKGERWLMAAKERRTAGSEDPGGGHARQDPRIRVKGAVCFFSGRRCHGARQDGCCALFVFVFVQLLLCCRRIDWIGLVSTCSVLCLRTCDATLQIFGPRIRRRASSSSS